MTKSLDTLKQLEKEYNENNEKMHELIFRIKSLNGADIEYKASCSLVFGILPWLASIFASAKLYKLGIVSPDYLPILQAAAPAAIGISAQSIFLKVQKIKERLSSFTTAKSQKSVILERATYESELYVLEQTNNMLKQAYEQIMSNERMISSLSGRYNIYKKEDNNISFHDNIKELESRYLKQLEKLKVAALRVHLSNKYYKQRDLLSRSMDYMVVPMMSMVMTLIMFGAPIIVYNQIGNTLSYFQQIELLGVPAIATCGTFSYLLYRNKNLKESFSNLNNPLGDDKLPEKSLETEQEELVKELKEVINDTVAVKIALEEAKRTLEEMEKDDESISLNETYQLTKEVGTPVPEKEQVKTLKKVYPDSEVK